MYWFKYWFKFFISKSLNNGVLPFWNPYQLGGYPTFADPQSGVWFYPTWIISLLFGYSMSIIQLEFLFALIFGCIGFYKLSQRLSFNKSISSILAISYSSKARSIQGNYRWHISHTRSIETNWNKASRTIGSAGRYE